MLGMTALTLFLIPSSNRAAAHAALTSVGVPVPDHLPDRVLDMMDYWNIGLDDGSGDLEYRPALHADAGGQGGTVHDVEATTPHQFHPNGHLLVAPLASFEKAPAPHPILTLISRAEKAWDAKVAKQSRTLREAATEYRRRYKRNPPRGFDEWWNYAVANRVVLVDEYDQIHHDLEVFWALYVPSAVDCHVLY